MPNTVKLAFLGDIMLGRGISRERRRHEPAWFWGDTLPVLRQADAVFANLESPVTDSTERWRRTWKFFHFRADPQTVPILSAGGVRFVCLANNHMLDFGAQGLTDTLAALDRAGIAHAGAGRNSGEAAAGRLIEAGGLRLGVLAATDGMPEYAATDDTAGTNYVEFRADTPHLDWVAHAAAALRRDGADLIVLSLHWGSNMRMTPSAERRRFAHAAIERGVDIIHGHSAHVVQGVERHGKGVILYDTGNFIDDYWKFPFRRTVTSFVFMLTVEDGRPARLALTPVRIHPWPLGLATGDTFAAIATDMRARCAAFGTEAVDTPDGLEIALG